MYYIFYGNAWNSGTKLAGRGQLVNMAQNMVRRQSFHDEFYRCR